MTPTTRNLVIVVVVLLLAGAAWYFVVSPMNDANKALALQVKAKEDENAQLREYEPRLVEIQRQIASLQQQLEIQKTIVPDEKEVDQFIHIMQDTATAAGVEIRRYTAAPLVSREYYSEVPFVMDIDGPYYSVVGFFEKVSKLQRIINVEALQIATTKRAQDAKVKSTYTYPAGTTVVSSFTAKTFYSHDQAKPSAAQPAAGRR